MYPHPHHILLPVESWKRIKVIDHVEASKLTNGNTDKFLNRDYWTLGIQCWGNPNEIPIGTKAVYYSDRSWYVMERIKK